MSKLTVLLIVLLTVLLVQSCETIGPYGYKVLDKYDKFENVRTQQMRWNLLGNDEYHGQNIYFDLYKASDATSKEYLIVIRYLGVSWIFIPEGKTLVLLIDGEKYEFDGDGSYDSRQVVTGSTVVEIASYLVDKKMIEKICIAKKIELKVRADNNLVRYFRKTNFDRLKDFYNKNIKNDDDT